MDHPFGVIVSNPECADTGADGNGDGIGQLARRFARDGRAQALGDPGGRLRVGPGEQHGELLAADAKQAIGGTQGLGTEHDHSAQYLIAHPMAEQVVDRLEPVDVEQNQRTAIVLVPAKFGEAGFQLFVKLAAIAHARKRTEPARQ